MLELKQFLFKDAITLIRVEFTVITFSIFIGLIPFVIIIVVIYHVK